MSLTATTDGLQAAEIASNTSWRIRGRPLEVTPSSMAQMMQVSEIIQQHQAQHLRVYPPEPRGGRPAYRPAAHVPAAMQGAGQYQYRASSAQQAPKPFQAQPVRPATQISAEQVCCSCSQQSALDSSPFRRGSPPNLRCRPRCTHRGQATRKVHRMHVRTA